MQINLNADPDFRKMVALEVRAALMAAMQSELMAAIAEGTRRATGAAMEKVPDIVAKLVTAEVKQAVSNLGVAEQARQAIRNEVREQLHQKINEAAQKELNQEAIRERLKQKLANLTIHVGVI